MNISVEHGKLRRFNYVKVTNDSTTSGTGMSNGGIYCNDVNYDGLTLLVLFTHSLIL